MPWLSPLCPYWRTWGESESEFHKQFIDAAALSKKLHGDDFEFLKPRIADRQAHCDNVPSFNAEDY